MRSAVAFLLCLLFNVVLCRKKLLLVSFDGFRNMYHDTYYLPWSRYMRKHGSWASNISCTFPCDTFPNHWAIATGRHPESHGIVGNNFYDPKYQDTFTMSSKDPKFWNTTVPIWKTAVENGVRTASYFWVGSEVEAVTGLKKPYYHEYAEAATTSFADRLEGSISYLTTDGLDFVTLYYNEPDHTMHALGPTTADMEATLRTADDYIGMILMRTAEAGLSDSLDIIICADHGATDLIKGNRIYLADYIDISKIQHMDSGALLGFTPLNPADTEEMIANLTNVPHIKVYKKEDMPTHLHYENNYRIMNILVMADLGWDIQANYTDWYMLGGHGFDINYPEMKPHLMAIGPSFRENFELKSFAQTKDIYSLAAKLLDIPLYPGNSTEVLHAMLNDSVSIFTQIYFVMFLSYIL